MSEERRGILFVANRPMTSGGCAWLAVGVVFLAAALYGIYGDGSLNPGTWLAKAFVGGSAAAIVIGVLVMVAQRAAAKVWRGFAIGPDGLARAVFRAADPARAAGVKYETIPPATKGHPRLAIMLVHVGGEPGSLVPAHIAYHDGRQPVAGVHGSTARFGVLPQGTLAALPLAMRCPTELRPVADALREGCPGLPVSVLIVSQRTERKMGPAILFGLIGAAIDEAFAASADRKSRAALEEALGSDLGRDLAAFCDEYRWDWQRA
jgi:hypothetical protein